MAERDKWQIDHESEDEFKNGVVFPAIACEIRQSLGRGTQTLHIGVGSGQIAPHLAGLGIEAAYLVDTSEEMLEQAQVNFTSADIPAGTFHADATELLPIEPGSIDVAIASFSLNQMPEPEIVFDLVDYYLKPQGTFIVVVPDESYPIALADDADKLSRTVEGVLDRTEAIFRLGKDGHSSTLYPRPNTDYHEWFTGSGFNVIGTTRLVDFDDDRLTATPKAALIVGQKVPEVMSVGSGGEAVLISSTIKRGSIKSVEQVVQGGSFVVVCIEDFKTGEDFDFPFPVSKSALHLTELVSDCEADQLLVKRAIMVITNGNMMLLYKVYLGSHKLGHYRLEAVPQTQ